VSLYIRITDAKGRRKWETVGTDLNAASAAHLAKESELLESGRH